jgi:hypothetical protein
MYWSDIPRQPSARTLRWFALLWMLFFGSIAGWQFFLRDHETLALVWLLLALSLGPVGLVSPKLLRPVYVGSLIVTFPLNWLFSHLLLAAILYGLFTPLALLFRLMGRDALQRTDQRRRDTYWAPKPEAKDMRSYFRLS